MLIFNLTTLHLWGRVLGRGVFLARVLAYADDGYIKAKMSVAHQVFAELKHVLKEDAGLDLNVSKTSVFPKDVTQRLRSMWRTTSSAPAPHSRTSAGMFPSPLSVLKVLFVSVCLLALMHLYINL
jgi:hypothetical protein